MPPGAHPPPWDPGQEAWSRACPVVGMCQTPGTFLPPLHAFCGLARLTGADKDNEMVTMQVDDDHPIIVYKLDSVADIDSFITLLETTGCKLVSEDAFQSGSFDVTPYSYTYLENQGFFYRNEAKASDSCRTFAQCKASGAG